MSNTGLDTHLVNLLIAVGDVEEKLGTCPICGCVKPAKHKIGCEFGSMTYNAKAIFTILRRTNK